MAVSREKMSTNVKRIPSCAVSLMNRKHMTLNRNKAKSSQKPVHIWEFGHLQRFPCEHLVSTINQIISFGNLSEIMQCF